MSTEEETSGDKPELRMMIVTPDVPQPMRISVAEERDDIVEISVFIPPMNDPLPAARIISWLVTGSIQGFSYASAETLTRAYSDRTMRAAILDAIALLGSIDRTGKNLIPAPKASEDFISCGPARIWLQPGSIVFRFPFSVWTTVATWAEEFPKDIAVDESKTIAKAIRGICEDKHRRIILSRPNENQAR